MAAEVRRLIFAEGVQVTPTGYSVLISRGGIVDLSIGESNKTIVFSSAMQNSNFCPSVSILCDDSNPIFLNYIIKNRTINGFDIYFNAPVDSNNYKISYIVGEQL